MNYERCISPDSPDRNVQSNGLDHLVPVYDIVTQALGLANDIGTLTGTISDKLFGSAPQTPTNSVVGLTLPPCCVVDFLEVIIVVLEGTAKRLKEIDNRL